VTARGRPMCDRIMGRTQAWIAAENGYFLRRGPDAEWETPFDNVDISWIPEVRTIFQYFSQRTPKSFIEERTSYLSWHYHDCDQYFGERQVCPSTSLSPLPLFVIALFWTKLSHHTYSMYHVCNNRHVNYY
jgi:trehalose-6-phosphatase